MLGASALLPLRAAFPQSKIPRVGFLSARSREAAVEITPFLDGMRALSYVEGKNIQYEWRFGDGRYERLDGLAAELVALKVDVIVASTTPAARAAHKATASIPIVTMSVNDPVKLGLANSIARPGGNVTGLVNLDSDMREKQFSLLLTTLPKLARLAVLFNPANPMTLTDENVRAAAKGQPPQVIQLPARTAEEIDQASATMRKERVQAVVVLGDAFFLQRRSQLVILAAKNGLPAIYNRREYVDAGGLMSYGRNTLDIYRRAASYVDTILKGAKPAEMPFEQPTSIELVINKNAAKALGFKFPGDILVRADKVIE